jgi:tetratricopeptide (TPR) repeat protein
MDFHPPGTYIGPFEVAGQPLFGGMGIVYVCFDHEQGRPVALKTFQSRYLPDRAARDRFLREGTAWVELGSHPHIVRCQGVLHPEGALEVYLVLELVAKEQDRDDASLRSWLTPGRPLPIEQALLFGLQITRGMRYATDRIPGLVHRDLKPENVLVGADQLLRAGTNRLRLTDFGLVAILQETTNPMPRGPATPEVPIERTQLTQGIMGTPLYMAPEQWHGEAVSAATDVYALGCILYQMLTGQHAVTGQNVQALQRAHCAGEVRSLPNSLPAGVRATVARCLALQPGERYDRWEPVETALMVAYEEATGFEAPASEPPAALSWAERVQAGWSYSAMGTSYVEIGKAEVAAGYFERAAEVGRTEGDLRLVAGALGNLGEVNRRLGNARRAIEYHEQHLELVREIGDRRGEEYALGNLGGAYGQLGDLRRALDYLGQALALARKAGHRRGAASALDNLGIIYAHMGDFRRAISYYEQALNIAREIGDRTGEGAILGNLGTAFSNLGDLRRAIGYYKQSLAIKREIGDRRGEGVTLHNLGNAYRDLGNARQALEHYGKALEINKEIGDQRGIGLVLNSLGSLHSNLGDMRRALELHGQALEIIREAGDRRSEGDCLTNMGYVYMSLKDIPRAMQSCEQALAIDHEIGDIMGVALDSFNMANLLAQQGRFSEALPYAEESAKILDQVGHMERAQQVHQMVVDLRAAIRCRNEALEA